MKAPIKSMEKRQKLGLQGFPQRHAFRFGLRLRLLIGKPMNGFLP